MSLGREKFENFVDFNFLSVLQGQVCFIKHENFEILQVNILFAVLQVIHHTSRSTDYQIGTTLDLSDFRVFTSPSNGGRDVERVLLAEFLSNTLDLVDEFACRCDYDGPNPTVSLEPQFLKKFEDRDKLGQRFTTASLGRGQNVTSL